MLILSRSFTPFRSSLLLLVPYPCNPNTEILEIQLISFAIRTGVLTINSRVSAAVPLVPCAVTLQLTLVVLLPR